MDTLILKRFFQIIEINNFQGDLTDISAKKEALEQSIAFAVSVSRSSTISRTTGTPVCLAMNERTINEQAVSDPIKLLKDVLIC